MNNDMVYDDNPQGHCPLLQEELYLYILSMECLYKYLDTSEDINCRSKNKQAIHQQT